MIICAGEGEQFDFALPVGIGMTDTAINLTRLCLAQKPKFILFVGTAGSYGEKKVFDIIESKTAVNIENSFFTGGSYTPIDNMVSTAEDVSRETIVNTSNYITTDKSLGKVYLSKNIHLENMEYYAVLKVAKSFDIPAAGVFVVTNYCDENAHKDFMDNRKEAMLRITEYIKESK
ncbi:MAG: purine-nucleoside phosphorylase [Sulfurovum sp.]|uniref:5'-methylthioadenosine/S-adenosylhomocysteine nucleosidase family protein n=1 Tax=Sulfurovum sp. TaxID=1969726 RepID=UPI002867D335|nr:purine-nucleoside phosphorylase [Sulfurovum sp.]MCO4844826.1 purine-nucleoside phosphorylase [Sulfurovum sp.]